MGQFSVENSDLPGSDLNGNQHNVDSYRRRAALERKHKGPGRPQSYATIKDIEGMSPSDNQTKI